MRKLIETVIFKFIELKVWLHMKKNGTPFDILQYSLFWMLAVVLASALIGKIL